MNTPSGDGSPSNDGSVTGADRIVAHAKLTIGLRITGVRPDGYHLIDAEMVTLALADTLTISPIDEPHGSDRLATEPNNRPNNRLTVSGAYATGVPLDSDNLVARALDLTGRLARVHLDKQIPHGGGLGGGSADAAAILRWAGWTPTPDLLVAAAGIGADVAFCLAGGRARVRGIGESVTALAHLDRTVTLVIPPLRVSTPAAYRRWDELGGPIAAGPNDLEPAAISLEPELARWRDRIGEATGRTPVLAGSGATWFVHGRHDRALDHLTRSGAQVLVTHTVPA
ncbi:MAG: 4-diphosphocytidyl-2-C-methyl-D-erythritol kinase [Actinomycetota bacterium]